MCKRREAFSLAVLILSLIHIFYSYYSEKECQLRIQKLEQAVREICAGLSKDQNLFDRELKLHDTLLEKVTYDKSAVDSADTPESFTAYGALVEGKAVCQGYALAMKLLLCYAGIESSVFSGNVQGVAHAWNAVLLNNQWYFLDPTWNETETHIRYDYFNIATEALMQDHTIDPVYPDESSTEQCNLWLPDCIATEENYYMRCAIYMDGFDAENDERLLTKLQTMLATGNTVLNIRFDPEMDYDKSLAMLITEKPYKLVYLMQRANQMYGSVNLFSMNNIQYSQIKAQHAVTIRLELETTEIQ